MSAVDNWLPFEKYAAGVWHYHIIYDDVSYRATISKASFAGVLRIERISIVTYRCRLYIGKIIQRNCIAIKGTNIKKMPNSAGDLFLI